MHKSWLNANKCPYCTAWFVVSTMLHDHLSTNRCGLAPADWAENPPKG